MWGQLVVDEAKVPSSSTGHFISSCDGRRHNSLGVKGKVRHDWWVSKVLAMVDDKFTSLKSQLMSASNLFIFFEFLKVPMRIKHDKKKKKTKSSTVTKKCWRCLKSMATCSFYVTVVDFKYWGTRHFIFIGDFLFTIKSWLVAIVDYY
jgi:hypothetical protein